ncbi:MAG: hypothetical protein HYU05_00485 [Candidatus Wildermuthbacteria bacterium]|nr:hypothetical protein [Candidatus Wildermuthbacteria bacterium]
MRVFEFHLNQKNKKDSVFKAYAFEPKKSEDKRKGNLYVVGELAHGTPRNARLFEAISSLLKEEYYSPKAPKGATQETLLKNAVKALNLFLEGEEKKGNIEWLGNLHLAIWCCSATGGNSYYFHSTKSGGITLLLFRGKTLVNLGRSIEQSHQTMNPVKVFGNIASGRVLPADRIVVATKDLAEVLLKEKLLERLAEYAGEKQFAALFKEKEKMFSKTAGLLFFVIVEEPRYQAKVQKQQEAQAVDRSFKKILLPNFSMPKFPMLTVSRYSFPLGHVVTVGLFVALMGVGLFFFRGEQIRSSKEMDLALESVQTLEGQARTALERKDEKGAMLLLKKARSIIDPYVKPPSAAEDFLVVQKRLEEKLFSLNNVKTIVEPEVLFTFNKEETNLIPQRLLLSSGRLYAFNPFFNQIYSIDSVSGTGKALQSQRALKRGGAMSGVPVFFADPNILVALAPDGSFKEMLLPLPSADFQADALEAFQNNAYFLDGRSGQIVQYAKAFSGESFPVFWIDPKSDKNVKDAKALAIDGNLWALFRSGEVQRYFKGLYQESIVPVVFPSIKEATQIKTSPAISALYILDASHARVIALSKFGDLIAQYTSPKFDNLLDIAVSEDGSTLYLLNGFTIYEIDLF